MASEWPVFVELCRVDGGIPQVYDSSNRYRDDLSYGLMEAARAWQAFRDFLNGVDDGEMDQWNELLADACTDARGEGYADGFADGRIGPDEDIRR